MSYYNVVIPFAGRIFIFLAHFLHFMNKIASIVGKLLQYHRRKVTRKLMYNTHFNHFINIISTTGSKLVQYHCPFADRKLISLTHFHH